MSHSGLDDTLIHFGRPHLLIIDELGYPPLIGTGTRRPFRHGYFYVIRVLMIRKE